jgi:uncharacterized protein (TIGR01370 family)
MPGGSRQNPVSARARLPLLAGLALAGPAIRGSAAAFAGAREPRFLVYYGRSDLAAIRHYDVAVLDSDVEADIPSRRSPGGVLLGYLSLGEVHGTRAYFPEVHGDGLLLDANPNWPDARFVDVRAARWRDRIVAQLVPAILSRGFDGLFFDTLDSAEFLETRNPTRFAGMVEGAADLVRSVRQSFPGVPIMVNRGYAVLPRIAGKFDMLLGESVRTTLDARSGTYRPVPESGYLWQAERMRRARDRDPRLRLFSLDYWDPEDREGIARIYAGQRANGFVPYVGTLDLTSIVAEP